jgi:hypothetical protein
MIINSVGFPIKVKELQLCNDCGNKDHMFN